MSLMGPVFDTIEAVLSSDPAYRAFRAGTVGRNALIRLVDAQAPNLVASGLPAGDVPFVKRLPACIHDSVRVALQVLHDRGLIATAGFDRHRADEVRRLLSRYEHARYRTYIYPEEGLLLWGLMEACRPRHAIFLGSYYGYWAHWALPAIAGCGGRATLVDPDARCAEVARSNAERSGFGAIVEAVAEFGEVMLQSAGPMYDFVVIDAENPRDHPEPGQRGKRVYHSLLQSVLPRMTEDALLVCHNILFRDETEDPAFDTIIARNQDELGPFLDLAGRHFDFVEFTTTEGVGAGRRRKSAE